MSADINLDYKNISEELFKVKVFPEGTSYIYTNVTDMISMFEYATVFNQNTPHLEIAKTLISNGHKVQLVDYQPTTEEMIIDFAAKIKSKLPNSVKLHHLRLQETATCYAEWFATDQ